MPAIHCCSYARDSNAVSGAHTSAYASSLVCGSLRTTPTTSYAREPMAIFWPTAG